MIKTVSKDLAVKLKEHGFPQESYLWWFKQLATENKDDLAFGGYDEWVLVTREKVDLAYMESARAFATPTAEEVLDELKFSIEVEGEFYYLSIIIGRHHEYYLKYYSGKYINGKSFPDLTDSIMGINLAEAAAKMYLYLAEKGLLK